VHGRIGPPRLRVCGVAIRQFIGAVDRVEEVRPGPACEIDAGEVPADLLLEQLVSCHLASDL
jgi:hypothetical protein